MELEMLCVDRVIIRDVPDHVNYGSLIEKILVIASTQWIDVEVEFHGKKYLLKVSDLMDCVREILPE